MATASRRGGGIAPGDRWRPFSEVVVEGDLPGDADLAGGDAALSAPGSELPPPGRLRVEIEAWVDPGLTALESDALGRAAAAAIRNQIPDVDSFTRATRAAPA